MKNNPIMGVPLGEVMRAEIALPLQHLLRIYTVGSFLHAWANPKNHRSIELIFQTPQQARHAATVCAAWLGMSAAFTPLASPVEQWWSNDLDPSKAAINPASLTTGLLQTDLTGL